MQIEGTDSGERGDEKRRVGATKRVWVYIVDRKDCRVRPAQRKLERKTGGGSKKKQRRVQAQQVTRPNVSRRKEVEGSEGGPSGLK